MRTKDEIIADILEYFKTNSDVFNECIDELDSYNGYLGDDRLYSMEDLDEIYHDTEPTEILYRAFFGHDADSFHTNSYGERIYGEFNPMREYFYFNGYGNLVSTDWIDYSDKLDEYAITELYDYRNEIYAIEQHDELADLFIEWQELEAEAAKEVDTIF